MVRPIETLRAYTLLDEGVIRLTNGQDFREGVRLADGVRVRVGPGDAEVKALGPDGIFYGSPVEHQARVVVDPDLRGHEWAVDWEGA